MKLYISSDMEGTAGITHWDETDYIRGNYWYQEFRELMTQEVAAACRGAQAVGAEVLVKDAHETGRNIFMEKLPRGVRISRAWSGHPFMMVAGLEDGFDALAFTGYHAPAFCGGNPLSHTMNTKVDWVKINGEIISEFVMHSYVAGMLNVPVVFLSGDAALCEQAQEFVPGITTVATSVGRGNANNNLHPLDAQQMIEEKMREALAKDHTNSMIKMPSHFEVEIMYKEHPQAFRFSQYPAAKLLNDKTIGFASDDYMEIMRFFLFVL